MSFTPLPNQQPIAWPTFWVVMAGCFFMTVTAQVIGQLGSDINGDIFVTPHEGLWLTSTYLAIQILVIPIAARSVGPMGLRAVLMAAAAIYVVFCLLSATTQSYALMFLWRIGIALSAGAFLPLGILIVFRTFGPTNPMLIPFGLAVFACMASAPTAMSSLISASFAEFSDWQGMFVSLAAMGACLFVAASLFVPKDPTNPKDMLGLDWMGVVLIGLWIIPFVALMYHGLRLDWWAHPMIRLLTLVSVAGFFLQVTYHWRHPNPIVDIHLLFDRPNFGLACAGFLFFRFGLLGLSTVYPQFLVQVQGLRIEQIGDPLSYALLPMLLCFPVAFFAATRLDPKYALSFGMALFGVGALMNIQLSADWSLEQFHQSLIVVGIGQPFFMVGLLMIATTGVGPPQGPSAASLINMSRVLGQSIGVAWITTMISKRQHYHSSTVVEAASSGNINIGDRLQGMAASFLPEHGDEALAQVQAVSALARVIRRESSILAFNDVFIAIGLVLVASALMLLVLLPSRRGYLPPRAPENGAMPLEPDPRHGERNLS